MTEYLWMEHEEHGGRAVLPDIPYWRAIGWHPCDGPPPEVDLTRDENTVRPEPASSPEEPGVAEPETELTDEASAPETDTEEDSRG